MESKFFISAEKPEDWRWLLADPIKHWKPGYSAMALAYCWQEANGFPGSVKDVFRKSKVPVFQDVEMLVSFPEYKTSLPGGRNPSQSDILILAKSGDQLISIAVEGKASESFGDTVFDWFRDKSPGKRERLDFLRKKLQINEQEGLNEIRYQLLHRTASAIIAADKFNTPNALMLVHSFSNNEEAEKVQFDDYCRFLKLFDAKGERDSLVKGRHEGVNLYFAWVKGEKECLKVNDFSPQPILHSGALKRIRYIHELSQHLNKTNHSERLIKLTKEHTEEIEVLFKNNDQHYLTETGDLIILCIELLLENNQSIDEMMEKCFRRYEEKLPRLIGELKE